jgi:hypothetical protein
MAGGEREGKKGMCVYPLLAVALGVPDFKDAMYARKAVLKASNVYGQRLLISVFLMASFPAHNTYARNYVYVEILTGVHSSSSSSFLKIPLLKSTRRLWESITGPEPQNVSRVLRASMFLILLTTRSPVYGIDALLLVPLLLLLLLLLLPGPDPLGCYGPKKF